MDDVSVKSGIQDSYYVKNETRDHSWFSDEPKDVGGTDLAPKPSELLLSALASCKLITMRMYGLRKGWDVDGMNIELKILEKGDKTVISKGFTFPEGLDEAQKNRLIEISGRCPVAKMVKDSVEYVLS